MTSELPLFIKDLKPGTLVKQKNADTYLLLLKIEPYDHEYMKLKLSWINEKGTSLSYFYQENESTHSIHWEVIACPCPSNP
jgi:hypothetical protein